MNDHDEHADTATGIDEDRTEGSAKQMGGKLKEGAGDLFGDAKMKNQGGADQAEGKLQNAWAAPRTRRAKRLAKIRIAVATTNRCAIFQKARLDRAFLQCESAN